MSSVTTSSLVSSSSCVVAKTYKINNVDDSLFGKSSPEIRKVIVEIGCSVYGNLSSITSVRSNQDAAELEKAKEFHHDEIASLHEEYALAKRAHTDEEERLKGELEQLSSNLREYYDGKSQCELDRTMEHNRLLILQYKETIESLRDNIKTLEEVRGVQEESIRKYERKDSMKTVERGIEGETSVLEYLGRTFTEGHLENTTKRGSHGDIHYTYQGVEMLLEVKNKDSISLDDISKFKRDLLETKCEGGIFISVKRGVKIPCHSIYDIEWIDEGVPVMYLTNFEVCDSMVYTAVKTIHYYVKHCKKRGDESERKVEDLRKLLEIVKCFSYSLEDISIDSKRISDRVVKLQTMIKEKVDLHIDVDERSYASSIHDLFRSYELSHNELPSEDYLVSHGIARKTIKEFGGLKELKKRYNMNALNNE